MKPQIRVVRSPFRGAVIAFALVLATMTAVAGEIDAGSVEPEPAKNHTLFVGLECEVTLDGRDYVIRDVNRSNVLLQSNDTVASVRIRDIESYNVRAAATVAAARMAIENLRHERSYSVLADPELTGRRTQQALAFVAEDRVTAATANLRESEATVEYLASFEGGSPMMIAFAEERAEAARQEFNTTLSETSGAPFMGIDDGRSIGAGEDRHDTLLVRFDARASRPIRDAYAIMLTEYTTPRSPKETAVAMHFAELPRIGAKPRNITIRKTNFPSGFQVKDVQVHVFSRGIEIASNLSEKSTAVTAEEALFFLQMAHVNAHRQKDSPPSLIRELVPPSLVLPEDSEFSDQSVVLTIRENGVPQSIPDTLVDGRPIDPQLKALLAKARFHPAMTSGMPVASEIEFHLRELFQ